jgi:two-component system, NtrC family, nitrogen regulation response regulator NtrX
MPANDILVVDDESEIVRLIIEVLTDEGYTTRSAHDGPGALREIKAATPALVLLDYWMPGMTGAEVLVQVRSAGYSELPIVLMSAGTRAELAQQSGASAFLPKPFDITALIACVAQFFEPSVTRSAIGGT